MVARGEIWWATMPEKKRPVLVLTRDAAIGVLNAVVVAPLTTRSRGIPTEVPLAPADDGVPRECVASLDNLTRLPKDRLTQRITRLSPDRMREVCDALTVSLDC